MNNEDFFEDETESAPDENQLLSIEEMVNKAMKLQAHIAALEEALKQTTKEWKQVVEKDLVERLTAAGTMQFVTTAGLKVSIDRGLFVEEIKSADKRRALMERRAAWLEANGGDSLIRENVEMVFDKGQHTRAMSIMAVLTNMGYDFHHGHDINTASFKAFVNDVMHEHNVPLDDLGLFQKTEAKITLPVERKSRRKEG